MTKKLVFVLVAISLVAILITVAATTVAPKTVHFGGAHFQVNKLVIKFAATGFTPRSDIRASLTVDHKNYPLKCKLDVSKDIACSISDMVRFGGLPGRIWLAGSEFQFQIPYK